MEEDPTLDPETTRSTRGAKSLADEAPDIICVRNADGELLDLSTAPADLIGIDQAALIRASMLQLIHPDDRAVGEMNCLRVRVPRKRAPAESALGAS